MSGITSLMQIPTPAFLFESDVSVTNAAGVATAWSDTKSNSGLVAAQADPTKRPGYTAINPAFNGYPTLDWALADVAAIKNLETGALSASIAKPITLLAAIRCTSLSASQVIVNNRNPQSSFQLGLNVLVTTGAVRVSGFAAPGPVDTVVGVAVNELAVLCAVANPSIGAIYKNGVLRGYGALGTGNLDGIRIGASGFSAAGVAPFIGSMATIGGWARELSFGEILQASQFLMKKYGVPLPVRNTA